MTGLYDLNHDRWHVECILERQGGFMCVGQCQLLQQGAPKPFPWHRKTSVPNVLLPHPVCTHAFVLGSALAFLKRYAASLK